MLISVTRYYELEQEIQKARADVSRAETALTDLKRQQSDVRKELEKTVGRNIPERYFIIDKKIIVVRWNDSHVDVKLVAAEDSGEGGAVSS